jgi:high-affinity nickel-transport protein
MYGNVVVSYTLLSGNSVVQPLAILGTALLLGVKHGIDWDHIAAIVDIAGASTAPDGERGSSGRGQAFGLCLVYALGHAFVVAILGVAAIAFAAILPAWVDQFSERIVGITLLILGVYVVYSVSTSLVRGETDFKPQSRCMLLMSLVQNSIDRCRRIFDETAKSGEKSVVRSYGVLSVFIIGMLHGIGAETGTQVLLIAALGGAGKDGFGLAMLLAFIVGLIVSNSIVAFLATKGITRSIRFRPLYLAASAVVAMFSLIVGTFFVLGASSQLPDLQVALSRGIDQ